MPLICCDHSSVQPRHVWVASMHLTHAPQASDHDEQRQVRCFHLICSVVQERISITHVLDSCHLAIRCRLLYCSGTRAIAQAQRDEQRTRTIRSRMAPVATSDMEAPASVASVKSLRSGGRIGGAREGCAKTRSHVAGPSSLLLLPMHAKHGWPIRTLHRRGATWVSFCKSPRFSASPAFASSRRLSTATKRGGGMQAYP